MRPTQAEDQTIVKTTKPSMIDTIPLRMPCTENFMSLKVGGDRINYSSSEYNPNCKLCKDFFHQFKITIQGNNHHQIKMVYQGQ